MPLQYRFDISKEKVDSIISFAENIWSMKAQSRNDFGSNQKREQSDFIADTTEGKMAEEGIAMFLNHNFDMSISVDYDIYPDINENDFGNDLQKFVYDGETRTNIIKVDVKSSRPYSKWLLIEKHKCWADVFVSVSVNGLLDNWEQDPYDSIGSSISVDISGFCYHSDIVDMETKRPWFIFKRGEQLINPVDAIKMKAQSKNAIELADLLRTNEARKMNIRLKSPINFGIPKSLLRNSISDWSHLTSSVIVSAL